MRLLHAADTHLGQCLYGPTGSDGVEARLREQGALWYDLCGAGVEQSVDLFVFAGDAFRDPNPSPTQNLLFQRGLLRLQRAGIPVVAVVGNHDWDGTGKASALEVFADEGVLVLRDPGAHLIHDVEGSPLAIVVGIPYFRANYLAAQNPHLSKEELNERASAIAEEMVTGLLAQAVELNASLSEPVPIVGVAHHNVEGSKLSSGYETAGPGDLRIPLRALDRPEFSLVCLGHIHKRQQLAERVWYAGSPMPLDFGEERDEKGYILAKCVRHGRAPIVTPVNLESRRFITIDLDFSNEDNPGALFPLRDQLQRPANFLIHPAHSAIVRVRYACTRAQKAAISHNEIADLLQQAGAWHLHSITPTLTDAGQVVRVEGLTSTAIDPYAATEAYINSRPDYAPHREGLLRKLNTLLEEDSTRASAA